MVVIPPFEVTIWVESLEHKAKYDLAGSCSPSPSIDDLIQVSTDKDATLQAVWPRSLKLTYGPMRGSDILRQNIAALYQSVRTEDILTTNGGIGANQIVLQALLSSQDHVICVYPTYEQLYQTPRMLGADVTLWKHDPSRDWELDLDFLRSSIKSNTKMIVLNSPNNPTGFHISRSLQRDIVQIAREHNLILFCDEVFRLLFRGPEEPPSFVDLDYDRCIISGSMSKAFGVAGTRVGWIASRDPDIIAKCALMRHYTNISVSQIDERIAAEALSDRCRPALLTRNKQTAETNAAALEAFTHEYPQYCSFVRPVAGTTAMLHFSRHGKPVDDQALCMELLERLGIFFTPASSCFGDRVNFKGYVRVNTGSEVDEFKEGLKVLKDFMKSGFDDVPLAT